MDVSYAESGLRVMPAIRKEPFENQPNKKPDLKGAIRAVPSNPVMYS
jgi:hypothetical protein